ncbi:MFS transporter [Marinobacter sp. CHS3-4]|uniref:MFS transporter n=1 Tax=Marinobacter sp. CHS3-4 TaxID=3045174 RepID=UPI0024B4D8A6|nr:MFS transporter [Marinobacter sp. CHS3-4]MDI9244245.1 MFS transporter [Marinobacter sp. CHS3-4]
MRPIGAILGSVALLQLGSGLLNTLLSVTANEEGFSTARIGLIMSGFFIGFACGIFISGRLIRRMGHIRTFAFCAAVCASIALLHSLWVNPWAWMLLRFLYGLALVTLMTVTESWLNTRAEKHERGRVFATYMVVNLGGIALAQQLLHLSPDELFLLFSISAILSCWALLPITISSRSQPHIPERAKSSLKKIIGFAPLAVATSLLSGLAMGAFWGMAPLYATRLGFDLSDVGLLMSLTIVGGALLQIPIGRFSDTQDRRKVLIVVAALAAGLCVVMPFAWSNGSLMAVFFLWGGLAFSLYPLGVAQLLDQLHPDEVVSGSTDMLVLHGAGAAVAPLLVGAIMNLVGLQGMPFYMATVLAVLAVYAIYQVRHVSVLTAGEQAHFEPMAQSSHEIVEMIER